MKNPYHLKIEIEKQTDAQKALWKGLISLWRQKSIYQIGIKELCQTSHVARSTFYVYYQNIDELADEMENFYISELIELNKEVALQNFSVHEYEFYQNTRNYIEKNKQVFYIWLIAYPNSRFIGKWKRAMKSHLWERSTKKNINKNQELIFEMIAAEVIAGYTYWLQNPYEIDLEKMNQIVNKTLDLIN